MHSDGPEEDVNLWRWYYDSRVYQPPSSSSEYNSEVALPVYAPPPPPPEQALPEHEVSESDSEIEHDTVIREGRQAAPREKKIKTIAKIGAVAGVSVILTLGIQTLINDVRNRKYVSAFFPASLADI